MEELNNQQVVTCKNRLCGKEYHRSFSECPFCGTKNDEYQVPTGVPNEQETAGCLGIGISFLFPIIGLVIYFVQRKKVVNPELYLYAVVIRVLLVFSYILFRLILY